MRNKEKSKLRQLVKQGWSFKDIRDEMDCCDATIRQAIKIFGKKEEG